MEVLSEFRRVRMLPHDLRVRLRSHFQTMYPNRRIFIERAVIGAWAVNSCRPPCSLSSAWRSI